MDSFHLRIFIIFLHVFIPDNIAEEVCIPGFVCVHGYCDKSTIAGCICDPGWKQPLCDKSECSETCVEGTTCALQQGVYECVNNTDDSTINAFTNTDLTTVSSSVQYCFNNSICQNGNCDVNEGRCICEQNWAGNLCHLRCPRACFLPEICVHRNDQFFCEETNNTNGHTENTTIPFSNQTRDVCSGDYHQRPEDERTCSIVLITCDYGICELERTGPPVQLKPKCICDPGTYGPFCEHICCLNCSGNGDCRLNSTGDETCQCYDEYMGNNCEEKRPKINVFPLLTTKDTSWTWWVIGGSIVVVLTLFVITGMVFYCMWRHRVLMIMKIVHRFQPFEDGDDKEFDAFVSYRSSAIDEDFVYKTLYPKLEKEMGFRLCLHYRDFIPGDTIANNIISAINNSRRTIIVLSPQYIQSDFTRFEYQVAQTEMLKRKHKIIPILLDDIKDYESEMDQNLKVIIESVTYIKWPRESNGRNLDHFWKQLQLSLPKKKKSSTESSDYLSTISSSTYHLQSGKSNVNCTLRSYSNMDNKYELNKVTIEGESVLGYHGDKDQSNVNLKDIDVVC